MLSNEALNSAGNIASALHSKGMGLVPVDPSPLLDLVKNTTEITICETDDGFWSYTGYDAEKVNLGGVNIINKHHDMVMDEVVPFLSKIVSQHISFAKNTVRGAVEELYKGTNELLSQFVSSALAKSEVVIYNYPQPFLNTSFQTSLDRYKDIKIQPSTAFKYELGVSITEQELLDKILTGNAEQDNQIKIWVNSLNPDFLSDVFSRVFNGKYNDELKYFIGNASFYGGNCFVQNLDQVLAIHLLARSLYEKVLEGTALSLSEYQSEFALLRDQTGSILYQELQGYEKDNSEDPVVIRVTDGYYKTAIVNSEAYNHYLNTGGDAESILGAVIYNSGDKVKSLYRYKELLEAKSELATLWNSHVGMINATEQNRKFVNTKQALRSVFQRMISQDETDIEIDRNYMLKLFDTELDKIIESDLSDNPMEVCLKLICRARYFKSDSERILRRIDEVMKENPKLSPREAATISTIDYLSFWLYTQMRVV